MIKKCVYCKQEYETENTGANRVSVLQQGTKQSGHRLWSRVFACICDNYDRELER